MNADTADISVVVPTCDDDRSLVRALHSIAVQTLQPREVVIVDDGSKRRSSAEMLRGAPPLPYRVIETAPFSGPGIARNEGLAAATCALVAFLDADDEWAPEKLEIQHRLLAACPDIAIVGHIRLDRGIRMPSPDPRLRAEPQLALRRVGRAGVMLRNPLPITTLMADRRRLKVTFPRQSRSEDYYFVAGNVLGGVAAAVLPIPLARGFKHRFGEDGLSKSLWLGERGELRTLRRLAADDLLPRWLAPPLYAWSLAKFLRRVAIVGTRRSAAALKTSSRQPDAARAARRRGP